MHDAMAIVAYADKKMQQLETRMTAVPTPTKHNWSIRDQAELEAVMAHYRMIQKAPDLNKLKPEKLKEYGKHGKKRKPIHECGEKFF